MSTDDTYRVYYHSANGPETDATWCVYVEHYADRDDDEPILGSTRVVSLCDTEAEAYAEAYRLQDAATLAYNIAHHEPTD